MPEPVGPRSGVRLGMMISRSLVPFPVHVERSPSYFAIGSRLFRFSTECSICGGSKLPVSCQSLKRSDHGGEAFTCLVIR
jgi:hypothetical protein